MSNKSKIKGGSEQAQLSDDALSAISGGGHVKGSPQTAVRGTPATDQPHSLSRSDLKEVNNRLGNQSRVDHKNNSRFDKAPGNK